MHIAIATIEPYHVVVDEILDEGAKAGDTVEGEELRLETCDLVQGHPEDDGSLQPGMR